jgi:hypothetical protein
VTTSGFRVIRSPRFRESRDPAGAGDCRPGCIIYGAAPLGSRTVNTEPLLGSLTTVTSPPIMRASLREIRRGES